MGFLIFLKAFKLLSVSNLHDELSVIHILDLEMMINRGNNICLSLSFRLHGLKFSYNGGFMEKNTRQVGLFSAIAIGVGCIIGSGWLFAAYYASKVAGAASIFSWIIGAGMALFLALLLGEIASKKPVRGLFGRLLSISHNPDMGFVIAISNWVGLLLTIPSEAQATIQYLSSVNPIVEKYTFVGNQLTFVGISCVFVLLIIYGLINYWGVNLLSKVTNLMSVIKIGVPVITGIIFLCSSFHASNFTAYHQSFVPYGWGSVFSAVVTCGIFYSFYGFGAIATFCAEIKNPKRNLPLALVSCVAICLIIYLLLQIAFIGALPSELLKHGWHHLDFTSPLAQLLIMLNINVWAICLYVDAAISPSGTATVYVGSAGRIFTAMSQDRQVPRFFDALHPKYNLSRRSLVLGLLLCALIVLFFRSWQQIMIVVAVFQLLTCVAIPIAFVKLREKETERRKDIFYLPFGKVLSLIIYILISYLIIQAGFKAVLFSLIVHVIFFSIYACNYHRELKKVKDAFKSSWSIFLYMVITTIASYLKDYHVVSPALIFLAFLFAILGCYMFLISQKWWG